MLEGTLAAVEPPGTPPRPSAPTIEFREIDLAALGLDAEELLADSPSSAPVIEFHEIDLAALGLDAEELAPPPRSSAPVIECHEIDIASLELDDLDELDELERCLARPEWLSSPAELDARRESPASAAADRPILEVEVGLISPSNFYAGLDLDLSAGGLFVATYELLPAGTNVLLSFVLPEGREVTTPGQVRWFKELCGDAPPGMGVAFSGLSPRDLRAIQRFCRRREPLYYEPD